MKKLLILLLCFFFTFNVKSQAYDPTDVPATNVMQCKDKNHNLIFKRVNSEYGYNLYVKENINSEWNKYHYGYSKDDWFGVMWDNHENGNSIWIEVDFYKKKYIKEYTDKNSAKLIINCIHIG